MVEIIQQQMQNISEEILKMMKANLPQKKPAQPKPNERVQKPGCKYERLASYGKNMGKIDNIDVYVIHDPYKHKHFIFLNDGGTLAATYSVNSLMTQNDLLAYVKAKKNLKNNRQMVSNL